jgi:hypothetical protein
MFFLFTGSRYYPSGGAHDFFGEYDSIEDAVIDLKASSYEFDWAHIMDESGDVVWDIINLSEEEQKEFKEYFNYG